MTGSANMADGLDVAWKALGPGEGRRVLIVLTDGAPDNRQATLSQRESIVRGGGGEIIARGVEGADTVGSAPAPRRPTSTPPTS